MATITKMSEVKISRPLARFGRVISASASWALLILAVLVATLLIEWVALGVVLLGSGPAPAGRGLFVIVPGLLVLAGLLAWLIARNFASWRTVGQKTALVAGLMVLAGAVWAVVASDQAFFLAREMAWGDSNVYTYRKLFASHPLQAATIPFHFAASPDPRVGDLFGKLSGASDWNSFLAKNNTQAFIVVHDGTVVYENYFNNTQRDSIVTSFSMAKSFTSALIGQAIQEGFIQSVDDPITRYLPELAQRDPRFKAITIRNLLMMSSGLEYQANRSFIVNYGDDPLTTYFPNQRSLTLENTRIIAPPGQYFLYNKYHPQLLGMILERTTGMSVTHYLQTKFWDPLGMEYAGSWSVDSRSSDFEKMEAGVNARAIDFAKFGELFLNGGSWNGNQIISKQWVDASTRPDLPQNYASYYPQNFATSIGRICYGLMWWDLAQTDGSYDYFASGDHGQFIYVSPQKHLVIVRNGVEYGIPFQQWVKLFNDFAGRY